MIVWACDVITNFASLISYMYTQIVHFIRILFQLDQNSKWPHVVRCPEGTTERIKFAWKNRHKFLKNYGIENDYFQEGCFWKLDLDFMSLSGMTRVKKFTKVTINRTENPENGGVRSPSLGACNSHNKPMQRHFYRLVYF